MTYRWLRRKRCPHSNLSGVYGDRINHVGGWRLWCDDCRRYIDGPVSLAESRRGETDPVTTPHAQTARRAMGPAGRTSEETP